MLEISLTAADGLLLLENRPQEAVALLTESVERLRELGNDYEAACLELDRAGALEGAGEEAAAEEARARSAAVLEPLRCVNPF